MSIDSEVSVIQARAPLLATLLLAGSDQFSRALVCIIPPESPNLEDHSRSIYSPVETTYESSFPELWGFEHVQNTIVFPVLILIPNFFLFELLYDVFELRGVYIHPISPGVFHKQIICLVQTIFGNQPAWRLGDNPCKKKKTLRDLIKKNEHMKMKPNCCRVESFAKRSRKLSAVFLSKQLTLLASL